MPGTFSSGTVRQGEGSQAAEGRAGRRILLIEDSVADARLIREMLQRAESVRGLTSTLEIVETGYLSEGLTCLAESHIDLVLLDLSLPDAQGSEAFERVNQSVQSVPVIVLTGANDEKLALHAVASGAQDYLVKGKIDGELLWQAVHYALERHHVQQEKQRLDARRRDTERWESLANMASGIGHDFNNLLTIILGNIAAVLDGAPDAAFIRSAMLDAHRATLRAAELTTRVLSYAGSTRLTRQPLNLSELVRLTLDSLRRQIPPRLTVRTDLEQTLPYAAADRDLLQQVLSSLLINSVEAIGEGEGELRITTGLVSADDGVQQAAGGGGLQGQYVFVQVTDTGCGMDETTRDHCFDPFFTTKFPGRGLGLASAFGIVRAHSGLLKFESEPGKGTTFRVLLPRQERPLSVVERPARNVVALPQSSKQKRARTVSGQKILVVEDDADLSKLAKWILETAGFKVLTARDGVEGLESFTRHSDQISAVLLDVTMPRMNGCQTLREILRRKPDARVVLCSGYAHEDVARELEDVSPRAFLQKPYTRQQLTQIVLSVLNS